MGEQYTAPLGGTDFRYTHTFALFSGKTVGDYRAEDVEYLIASSDIYDRYYDEPERYPEVVQRYEELFATRLIFEIRPASTRGGPTIRVYDIQ